MIFFYKESKSKKTFFGGWGREGMREGPRVSEFFYYESKSKIEKKIGGGGGGEGCGRR